MGEAAYCLTGVMGGDVVSMAVEFARVRPCPGGWWRLCDVESAAASGDGMLLMAGSPPRALEPVSVDARLNRAATVLRILDQWQNARPSFLGYTVRSYGGRLCRRLGAVKEGLRGSAATPVARNARHRDKPLHVHLTSTGPQMTRPGAETSRCLNEQFTANE